MQTNKQATTKTKQNTQTNKHTKHNAAKYINKNNKKQKHSENKTK